MQTLTAFEWLCVMVAESFDLDKKLFEERIQWVKDNLWDLPKLAKTVKQQKASLAIHSAIKTKKSNTWVMLDASCSGIQILSALTNCEIGAYSTGLIGEVVGDAYTLTTQAMNKRLGGQIELPRPIVKNAVMTAVYGSKATPKEIFADIHLGYETFVDACLDVAPRAFQLMPVLINSYNPHQTQTWILPDGFVCHIRATEKIEKRLYIEELNSTVTVGLEVEASKDYSVENAANITHSIDALVVRNMFRRCNYNAEQIEQVKLLLELDDLAESTDKPTAQQEGLINLAYKTRFVDPVLLTCIDTRCIHLLDDWLKHKLLKLINTMLEHPSFQITTNHDAFGCLASNCNRMTFWYREILAELSESNLLNAIWQDLGQAGQFTNTGRCIADDIRKSIYAIC